MGKQGLWVATFTAGALLGLLVAAEPAAAQFCCECLSCPNGVSACSSNPALTRDQYQTQVCDPIGCLTATCIQRECDEGTGRRRCPTSELGQCGDGVDNDDDGLVDASDEDCGGPAPTPTPVEDCCVARDTAECGDPSCEACVCFEDEFCCDNVWDQNCVIIAEGVCDPDCMCGMSVEPTPTPPAAVPTPTPGVSDCCAPRDTPGCVPAACAACVCAMDDFCCTEEWDGNCVIRAEQGCPVECACDGAVRPTATPPEDECLGPADCPPDFDCVDGQCVPLVLPTATAPAAATPTEPAVPTSTEPAAPTPTLGSRQPTPTVVPASPGITLAPDSDGDCAVVIPGDGRGSLWPAMLLVLALLAGRRSLAPRGTRSRYRRVGKSAPPDGG